MAATLLIVDDSRLNREVLKLALEPEYNVIEAENGFEAIARLQAHTVDLILLDLMMPDMDGFQFLEWRRANPVYSSIPVIVNSALDDFESIEKALEFDSYDYFTKPLTEQDLKVVLPLKIRNAVNTKQLYFELKRKNEQFQKEIDLAGKYQRFLLPDKYDWPGVEVAAFYQPFIGVAGDFFDVVGLEDAVAFFIADVSGHGLLSAMVSSILKPLFTNYITETRSPRKTLELLNRDLIGLTREEDYVTAFSAVYDQKTRRLTYASAGHPSQLFLKAADKKPVELQTGGFLLGMFENDHPAFEQREESLEVAARDRLLIFTDGVVEAADPDGELFGYQRWKDNFLATIDSPPNAASAKMWKSLLTHTKANLKDDVAFLVIEFGEDENG